MVGLYASFSIAIIIEFVSGRTRLQYLLAATILTRIIEVIFEVFGIAKLMRFCWFEIKID